MVARWMSFCVLRAHHEGHAMLILCLSSENRPICFPTVTLLIKTVDLYLSLTDSEVHVWPVYCIS